MEHIQHLESMKDKEKLREKKQPGVDRSDAGNPDERPFFEGRLDL